MPSWAGAKAEWSHASLGWFDESETLVGAGLVLLRQVPRVKRYLAYLPEGPDIDWTGERTGRDLDEWLTPMAAHLRAMGAFAVKMGPMAVVRRWHAETLKAAIATGEATRLRDVEPDESFPQVAAAGDRLRELGWSQKADTGAGFGDVQPRYVFQVPLAGSLRGRPAQRLQPALAPQHQEGREGRRRGRGRHAATTSPRSTRSTSRPRTATGSPRAGCRTSSGCTAR